MALKLDALKTSRTVSLAGDQLSVAREAHSDRLWVGSSDGKLYHVELSQQTPQPIAFAGHSSYVSGVALVSGTPVSCGWDRKLIWWDVKQRRPARTVEAHRRWIRQLALAPDGALLATVADDMVSKLWETRSGKLVRELRGHRERTTPYHYPNKLFACAFTPDSKFLAAADEMCQVIVWETATGKEAAKFDASTFFKADWDRNNHPYGGVRCLASAPDGRSLAVGGMQNADVAIIAGRALVQLFDWQTGKMTQEFGPARDSQYEALYFHPRGDWLLALIGGTNKGGGMHFFGIKEQRVLKEVSGLPPSFGLAVNETSEVLYTVGRDKVMKWEAVA